jgi:hypothetical protein
MSAQVGSGEDMQIIIGVFVGTIVTLLGVLFTDLITRSRQKNREEKETKEVLTMIKVELNENAKRVENRFKDNPLPLLSTSNGELFRVAAVKNNISPKLLKSILKVYYEFQSINDYIRQYLYYTFESPFHKGEFLKKINTLREECKGSIKEVLETLKEEGVE